MSALLLEAVDLHKRYALARPSWFAARPVRRAVDGVSFAIRSGRSFGVVGESGSGKSTLARMVMALVAPSSGDVKLEGRSLFGLSRAELKAARAHFQMIFQDPYGSLDPRHSIARIVAEPLANLAPASRAARDARVAEALAAVGLDASAAARYPHEFSGGQRQRIAIARVMVLRPEVLVLDEPTSALDVSVQQQVLALLAELQRRHGMSYIFISHDLAVVRAMSHHVMVMKDGEIIEQAEATALFAAPSKPAPPPPATAAERTPGSRR